MNCLSCDKPMVIKRTLVTWHIPHHQQVCASCFKQVKHLNPLIVIPIEENLMYVYELLYELSIEPSAFYSYLAPYILSYIKHPKKPLLIILDVLDEQTFKIIEQLKMGPLVVLTIKIKGEMFYEL